MKAETVNVIALQPNVGPFGKKYNMTNLEFAELFFWDYLIQKLQMLQISSLHLKLFS
jgi:hypothetical protein